MPIRIEHSDGKGPWHTESLNIYDYPELREFIDKHVYNEVRKGFPPPQYDGNLKRDFNKECHCAYKDLKEFRKWVSRKNIDALISVGFKIYELKLSVFYEGLHQVVYRLHEVKEKKNITNQFINN